ncbi:MAG: peptide chain release factor N(5)-glutamine methyltransferase [Bacteroidales bacterium]|nr:peptide chain release factor N(5)-glutamine methyltransferase [Bacteroidales bacterium]
MAVKLQTIKDIRNFLKKELSELYPENESSAIANLVIADVFELKSLSAGLLINDDPLEEEKAEKIKDYCTELKTGKPVQYVLGVTYFLDCIIKVRPGVLIPRPETEELADLIIRENKGYEGRIIDIGTGSGCIAIALANYLPSAKVTGIDISDEAIETAEQNAVLNKVDVTFLSADILNGTNRKIPPAGIIVSNPPYVRESEKGLMHRNVIDHEPHEALFVPDDDPLRFYKAILEAAPEISERPGKIYFEINETLGNEISELLDSYGYGSIRIIKDINGKDRIAKAVRHG